MYLIDEHYYRQNGCNRNIYLTCKSKDINDGAWFIYLFYTRTWLYFIHAWYAIIRQPQSRLWVEQTWDILIYILEANIRIMKLQYMWSEAWKSVNTMIFKWWKWHIISPFDSACVVLQNMCFWYDYRSPVQGITSTIDSLLSGTDDLILASGIAVPVMSKKNIFDPLRVFCLGIATWVAYIKLMILTNHGLLTTYGNMLQGNQPLQRPIFLFIINGVL